MMEVSHQANDRNIPLVKSFVPKMLLTRNLQWYQINTKCFEWNENKLVFRAL